MPTDSKQLFARALRLNLFLSALVAVIGSLIGYLAYGPGGVVSSLMGAAVSALFGIMTILSISFGSGLGLNGFYALVLGGWLAKVVVFALLLGFLQSNTLISGPMFFFALVASVLGGLAVDSHLVLTAKIPTVEN
jgi:hypothetical protein